MRAVGQVRAGTAFVDPSQSSALIIHGPEQGPQLRRVAVRAPPIGDLAAQEVRDRVDEVRRERRIFENLFQQMEGELIAQDAETRACNEEAERCYKERDAAQNDMKELKVRPTWPALSVR